MRVTNKPSRVTKTPLYVTGYSPQIMPRNDPSRCGKLPPTGAVNIVGCTLLWVGIHRESRQGVLSLFSVKLFVTQGVNHAVSAGNNLSKTPLPLLYFPQEGLVVGAMMIDDWDETHAFTAFFKINPIQTKNSLFRRLLCCYYCWGLSGVCVCVCSWHTHQKTDTVSTRDSACVPPQRLQAFFLGLRACIFLVTKIVRRQKCIRCCHTMMLLVYS